MRGATGEMAHSAASPKQSFSLRYERRSRISSESPKPWRSLSSFKKGQASSKRAHVPFPNDTNHKSLCPELDALHVYEDRGHALVRVREGEQAQRRGLPRSESDATPNSEDVAQLKSNVEEALVLDAIMHLNPKGIFDNKLELAIPLLLF